MRKSKIIKFVSFAVAVLLGLVNAQAAPATGIPTYADPMTQAKIGQQWVANSGVGAYGPASQAQISQEFAKAYGVGSSTVGPAGQASINGQWASQFGVPAGATWGTAAPTTQATSGATPLTLMSMPTGQNMAVNPSSATPVATPVATPQANTVPINGALVDPNIAAKIAQIQADYASKLQNMEMQQEMLELQLEMQLMNELAALQAVHAATLAQPKATQVPVTPQAALNTPTPANVAKAQISLMTVADSESEAEGEEEGQIISVSNQNAQANAAAGQASVQVAAQGTTNTVSAKTVGSPAPVVETAPVTPAQQPATIASPANQIAANAPVVTPTPVAIVSQPAPIVAQPVPVVVTQSVPVVPPQPAPVNNIASPLTTLMTDAQIFAQEKQLMEQIEILKSQRLKNTLTKTVNNYQTILNNQMTEFQLLLDSTVAQLKCDATCVNTCTAAAATLDAKAKCLDTCLCYATPAVPVTPATPVTPVTPATPVTPVVDVAPVAAPVVNTPAAPVDVAAAPQQTVVPEAAPTAASPAASAQQALFLSEDALVMSANGSLSGMVVLAATLGLITLVAGVALHLNKDENKAFYKSGEFNFFNFNKRRAGATQEQEEYLLIK